jgi:hypothetical protein
MDLRQAITTIDVHLSDKSDHLRHAWDVVHAVVLEVLKPSHNSARDAITPLVVRAVTTDGCHHKQWYLEAIAEALQIELPPHDLGIAP